ncbi:MAG: crossover junction endodeoxyribonuclease RuvC [Pseudomonadota bacterium]
MTGRVRILGIDPGSRVTGYGVVDSDGRSSRHVASGCIRAESGEFTHRLKQIFDGISAVVAEYEPGEIAIEEVFVHRSVSSALKLGQARGAALAAALARSLPVAEYSPTQVKRSITGHGHADKVQIQHMVKLLVGLHTDLAADQADALAIAICHAHHRASPVPTPAAATLAGARRRRRRAGP